MRVTLIHNAKAGSENAPTRKALVDLLQAGGHDVTYRSSKAKHWSDALAEPADVIVVAGGDGTIGKVVGRMRGRPIPLAILPIGTANNIAVSFGIARLSLEQQIASWPTARRRRLDVGLAHGPWGTQHFIESFGAGLLAWTIPHADASDTLKQLDHIDAKVSYALKLLTERLQSCAPIALELSLDGRDLSGEYFLFEALNTPMIGPNLQLAEHVDPGDGELDIVLVGADEKRALSHFLYERRLIERRLIDGASPPMLRSRRGSHVKMRWNGFDLHIDDEVWPGHRREGDAPATIDVSIEAVGVEVLTPF